MLKLQTIPFPLPDSTSPLYSSLSDEVPLGNNIATFVTSIGNVQLLLICVPILYLVVVTPFEVVEEMLAYIEKHLQNGGRLNQITRHMFGIFSGQPGAKLWRRNISEQAHKKGADLNVLINAVNAVALTNKNNDYLLAI